MDYKSYLRVSFLGVPHLLGENNKSLYIMTPTSTAAQVHEAVGRRCSLGILKSPWHNMGYL